MGRDVDTKFRGWYAALQGSLRSLEAIEREVEAQTGLPIAWIEVLVFLTKEESGKRRMGELAEQSLLSRGGATRLIARMEDAGLVTREIPPHDRRATFAVLTDKGRRTLEEATPAYQAAVARYFTDAIDEDEAETLRSIAVRVLQLTGDDCDWLVRDLTEDQQARDAR
jgi:DNA-binding MarR family transcriptional regulator